MRSIHFKTLALVCAIIVCGSTLGLAADPDWKLKTSQPDPQKIRPFLDSVSSLSADLEKKKDLQGNSASRLAQAKSLSGQFHQAVQQLTQELKQNGEVEAFNQLIGERLKADGKSGRIAELNQVGGAFNLLSNPQKFIDFELGELSNKVKASAENTNALDTVANILVGSLLQLAETKNAEAIAGAYGGGVGGTCSAARTIYYILIRVHPAYCIY